MAPRTSQEATPAAASEPGPSIPPPAKRSKRTKAEQAAGPTQPTKAAKAKPAPQPGSAEHAAHRGEQVAPTGAVLVASAGKAARQGQGVPRPGLQVAARQATKDPARCGTVVCGPPILSCHQLTPSACKTCQLYTTALRRQAMM
ncbi:hypothetical protein HaLaN_03927 [Haematococcus lacustris]|uniref:Uncharacterized protein n=1 Tax=Haematococcus lacustris TaxID=44745 RepID=A0A699YLZ0_HAELA|nr:hypothetical protein HaLaN_03927 [Haematococcus lacustris]